MTKRHPRAFDARRAKATAGDLAWSVSAVVAAVLAYLALAGGGFWRVVAVTPILLLVPGYLLLQASLVPKRPGTARLGHLLWSIGISPAVVGLAALATAVVPGGFRPGPIVASVSLVCLGLAAVAFYRRGLVPAPTPTGSPVERARVELGLRQP